MSNSRQVWDWIRTYIKLEKRYLGIALICAIGVGGMSLLTGYLLKRLLDAMGHGDQHQLNIFSVAIICLYGARWIFYYGQTVYFAETGQRVGLRLRNDIFEHLQGLSLGFFNRQRTGALMSTMNNDVPVVQNTILALKDIAPTPFQLCGGLVIIFWISAKLSLAAILVLPVMAFTINRLTRKIRQITSKTQDRLADVNVVMEETLSGIRIIQSFSAEQYEINRFQTQNQLAKDMFMNGVRPQAQLKPTIDIIGAIGVAFALWVGGHLVVTHEITIGDLGFFVASLNQIAVGISGLGTAKVSWEQVMAAGGRIRENVLDVDTDIRESSNAVNLASAEGNVEFRNVCFSYNEATPVLTDVSFTMSPGEVVAVVGPSGAGKSTIADLIPRFYDPINGEISVDGHNIRNVTIQSLRKQIGIVPQETVLFGGTIRDNIAYGDPNATDDMVEFAARAANAHDFITDPRILPDGYQTIVGERGKQLSGGQRQRISIARALLKNPRILILDEATSSLDAASEILVQEALEQLMQGRTTLVIAHRLSTIQNAHKILVLQSGRIVEAGSHSELIAKPGGLYAQLYETQFRYEGEPKSSPASVV